VSALREDHVVKLPAGLPYARDQLAEVHCKSAVEEYAQFLHGVTL
jgi:hypothetical protein